MLPNKILYKKLLQLYQDGEVFTAFDTETTGLRPITERVIEIGAVSFSKDGIIARYNTLINPCKKIPISASSINHITDDMLADKRLFGECACEFLTFIGDSILIAHNSGFDISFINTELDRCCLPKLENQTCDTVRMSKTFFPELPCHKLQFLAKHFKLDSGNAHRADDDARVCMEVFLRCLERVNSNSVLE